MTKAIRTTSDIAREMERQMALSGITAEVTFCRVDEFSVLVNDAQQFRDMLLVMKRVVGVAATSTEMDDELGHIAFYKF